MGSWFIYMAPHPDKPTQKPGCDKEIKIHFLVFERNKDSAFIHAKRFCVKGGGEEIGCVKILD